MAMRDQPAPVPARDAAPLGKLCITRKLGESILLLDDASGELLAEVTVARREGGRIRLVIDAPQSTHVLRSELARRIVDEPAATQRAAG